MRERKRNQEWSCQSIPKLHEMLHLKCAIVLEEPQPKLAMLPIDDF